MSTHVTIRGGCYKHAQASLYGGAWTDSATHLRTVYCDYTKVAIRYDFLGFRIKLRSTV